MIPQYLVAIKQNYSNLESLIKRVQKTTYTIADADNDVNSLNFGTDPVHIKEYIAKRYAQNEIKNIVDMSKGEVSPDSYVRLQSAPATTASVERSFSMLKSLLKKERNFKLENIEEYMIIFYNKPAFW